MAVDVTADIAGRSIAAATSTWQDCSRYCQGLCPCPLPPWLWKCNEDNPTITENPQRKFLFYGDLYLGLIPSRPLVDGVEVTTGKSSHGAEAVNACLHAESASRNKITDW